MPEADRVAVFDNDGTLSTEHPYAELAFALDRAAQLGQPVTEEDVKAGGIGAAITLIQLTHGSISTDDFDAVVRTWIATARHRASPFLRGDGVPADGRADRHVGAQRVRVLDLLGWRRGLHAGLGSGTYSAYRHTA